MAKLFRDVLGGSVRILMQILGSAPV